MHDSDHTAIDGRWQAGAVFFLCVLGLFFVCQLAHSPSLISILVFPYSLLAVKDAAHQWHHILSPLAAVLVDVVQWSLVTIAFAWLAGRVKMAFLVPLALSTMIVVSILVRLPVWLLGMDFYLG